MTESTSKTHTTSTTSAPTLAVPISLTSPNAPNPYCPSPRQVTSDTWTTSEQVARAAGYLADPLETTIVACTLAGCQRYFQNIERFAQHRRIEHNTTDIAKEMWVFGDPAGSQRGRAAALATTTATSTATVMATAAATTATATTTTVPLKSQQRPSISSTKDLKDSKEIKEPKDVSLDKLISAVTSQHVNNYNNMNSNITSTKRKDPSASPEPRSPMYVYHSKRSSDTKGVDELSLEPDPKRRNMGPHSPPPEKNESVITMSHRPPPITYVPPPYSMLPPSPISGSGYFTPGIYERMEYSRVPFYADGRYSDVARYATAYQGAQGRSRGR